MLQTVQYHDEKRDPKRPFVMKAPLHIRYIDDIISVFPDAVIVFCHRDPLTAVPSVDNIQDAVFDPTHMAAAAQY